MPGRACRGYTQITSFAPEPCRGGPGPTFFSGKGGRRSVQSSENDKQLKELQEKIENRLSELDPAIELIALEHPAGETLRLYIDHPESVNLALCERVTDQLRDLLVTWSLEVSSPGADRPLTKPEHFRRFLGRRVRVRTREAIEGQRSFTGTLTAADDGAVRLDAPTGQVEIPLSRIRRSNLVPDVSTLLEEAR
jgi:ribosome maturation factor RimP